jgi:hypothetical protein
MSHDPIRDAIRRAMISKGAALLNEQAKQSSDDADGPFDFYEARAVLPEGKTREQMVAELAQTSGVSLEVAADAYRRGLEEVRIAKSSKYQVAVSEDCPNGFGVPMVHLSIKRLDREPIRDWRELQQIKNAIVGEEAEAIEIYPADSRLVDAANQYHLWCFRPGFKIPVGFDTRLVGSHEQSISGSKQRRFESPDALLPTRAEISDSLRDLLACVHRGGTVPSAVRNHASTLVEQIEHARQLLPSSEVTVIQRLARALSLVKRVQDLIDPIICGGSRPHSDQEVSSLTAELVEICDQQLQQTRDDLKNLIEALSEIPSEQQS